MPNNPNNLEREMGRVLALAAQRAGLPSNEATLLSLHSNAIFLIPSVRMLVRIATNPNALPGAAAAVHVSGWLAGRGFPCTVPADIADQPFVVAGRVVTFWQHLPPADTPRVTAADLGHLLRELHNQPIPAPPPPTMTDPLDSVAEAVQANAQAIADDQREWLAARIEGLRALWPTIEFPHPRCLIHGDAHDNNLIQTAHGAVVLGDWDHVAVGPREWDLVQLHYTHRRFRRPDTTGLDDLAKAYGWDIRDWPGHQDLIAIREITGLSPYVRTAADKPSSAAELAHRLKTLQSGEDTARWNPPTRR
jgi:Ser/Thr protein kinase RdoA (MazF antagonist)